MEEAQKSRGWMPTRKWWFSFVTGAGTVLTMALTGDGINTDAEITGVIGIGVALVGSYIIPNSDAPGGVPDAQ